MSLLKYEQNFLNYLLINFLKTFFVFVFVFYCFGVILNLFEEVEFFKNINVSIFIPYAYKYFYSKYDNKNLTFHYFPFEYVVYDENKK